MPWTTPTLGQVRSMTKNFVLSQLHAVSMIPNSVTRVMSDAMSGAAFLCLLYVDWLSNQLLPDTAESVWLDRHGTLWLTNADGSKGRKLGTYASGVITMTGTFGTPVPYGTQLTGGISGILFQTQEVATIGAGPTPISVRALSVGAAGNLAAGSGMTLAVAIAGVDGQATVVSMDGGTDPETDDELRARVLERIQNPPMGGDADDYVEWSLAVGGVTRAWSAPNEMGIGTVTVRFMMDDLRSTNDGFPLDDDVAAVQAYLDTVRPVCVKDFFVEAPIAYPVDFTIADLEPGDAGTRAAVAVSVANMLHDKAAPGYALNGVLQPAQTIYAAWVSDAILNTIGVVSFDLNMADVPMPDNGHMAVLGTITYT